jgi:hypothetical protein
MTALAKPRSSKNCPSPPVLLSPHDYRMIPTFVAGILQTTRVACAIFLQARWNIEREDFRAGFRTDVFVSLS